MQMMTLHKLETACIQLSSSEMVTFMIQKNLNKSESMCTRSTMPMKMEPYKRSPDKFAWDFYLDLFSVKGIRVA